MNFGQTNFGIMKIFAISQLFLRFCQF